MSWTVKTLVLPLVLLCAWRLQEGAQACTCVPMHPQTTFCQADVVMKVLVVSRKMVGELDETIMYNVKPIKKFKGDHGVSSFYTAASSAACGVTLTTGVEYLITGRLTRDKMLQVSLCEFVAPWNSLSDSQKVNLEGRYRMGCSCQITPCRALPCRSNNPAECLWADFITNSVKMEQAKYFACLKKGRSPCTWSKGGADLPTKHSKDTKGR
uniref:metalloproteinase inhibitor 2-like n=1 Tax=Doryrhamphus excisus TaxID=161450 RepID=UPI0025ADACFA|nr:metalloproteinase inhibitor 2-like [Doryrhamphus excisus]